MNTHQAKRVIRQRLDEAGASFRLTARTIGFQDLARCDMVFVTIHDWTPNVELARSLKDTAASHGFRVDFDS